jgi:hypothetical protein
MRISTIASSLVTLSLGAFVSACGGAETNDGSQLSSEDISADVAMSDYEQLGQEITACDDNQYDHWRYLSALAVAAANELGRWDAAKDFAKEATTNNPRVVLSSTGLARCTNGCENIKAILQLQNTETSTIPRHDPLLLRQYMRAFYERQLTVAAPPAHSLSLAAVSPDVCGMRYHFNVGGTTTTTTTTSGSTLSGTSLIKPVTNYKCFDIASMSANDGALLQQWACGGASNQQFTLEAQANNTYRLKAGNSGKCLGVVGSATNAGALIEQRACGANNSQAFQLNVTSYDQYKYELKNVASGKCVEIQGGGYNDGQLAQLSDCNGATTQTFYAGSFAKSGGTTTTSTTTTAPSFSPSSLFSQLKFAGETENKFLAFQSTATQVSIDPMGTMIDGGSSASSGACYEGATVFSQTDLTGQCCSVSGKYYTLKRSEFNTKIYICR